MAITEGKQQDITQGRSLELDAGSIVVFDRGYTDFTWFNWLNSKEIYFVTRLKANTKYRVISRHPVNKEQGITSDQTLVLTGPKADTCPIKLRRMGYSDPGTGKHYVFLTHPFEWAAKTIADIYKSRWQIELFFKCIKQNLKIKSFVGTSKNAVMTQIGVAMCMYLMVAYLKFCSKLDLSIQPIIRLFQVIYLSEQICGDCSKETLQALLKLRSRCGLHSHESLWDSSDHLYTAVARAVLPCTHEKMTIFSGVRKPWAPFHRHCAPPNRAVLCGQWLEPAPPEVRHWLWLDRW